ncbi:hypothetical protein AADZ91_04535 [Colwelliaceae bacterium 6441]
MTYCTLVNFHELAKAYDVLYIEDNDAKSLAIYDVGNVELSQFVDNVKKYAYRKGVKKISAKVKEAQALYFFQHGFQIEATILAYYGLQDAVFVGYYLDENQQDVTEVTEDKILNKVFSDNNLSVAPLVLNNVTISRGGSSNRFEDCQQVVYSGRALTNHTSKLRITKFFAQIGDKIVATASAQFNIEDKAVEFSDFTVNVDYNINSLITYLLRDMEAYYSSKGCLTAFTIVSADSLAINRICAENHYEYGGTLKNESIIKGALTNLNTWFKRL